MGAEKAEGGGARPSEEAGASGGGKNDLVDATGGRAIGIGGAGID